MMRTHFIHYAVSPDRESWVERMERGCLALEKVFSPNRLMMAQGEYLTGRKRDRDIEPDYPVTDRRSYLRLRLKKSDWGFSLFNGKKKFIKSDGNGGDLENGHVGISGQFYGKNRGQTTVFLKPWSVPYSPRQ